MELTVTRQVKENKTDAHVHFVVLPEVKQYYVDMANGLGIKYGELLRALLTETMKEGLVATRK